MLPRDPRRCHGRPSGQVSSTFIGSSRRSRSYILKTNRNPSMTQSTRKTMDSPLSFPPTGSSNRTDRSLDRETRESMSPLTTAHIEYGGNV